MLVRMHRCSSPAYLKTCTTGITVLEQPVQTASAMVCVSAHTTFHSLHRSTLTVFTFSRRESKVSQGVSVTHKHTHIGIESRAVCMLLTPGLLVFYSSLMSPWVNRGSSQPHHQSLVSEKSKYNLYSLQRSTEKCDTLATANQHPLIDLFLEITHSNPSSGLNALVTIC